STGDNAGSFGNNILNTLDLVAALRVAAQVPGFVPPKCSDRYDALDAYPVDTVTTRGGDGSVNTLDLVAILKRVTNLDTARPRRTSRGLACPDVQAQRRVGEQAAQGALEMIDGALYLRAFSNLHLGGLAISLRSAGDAPIEWIAAK